MTITKSQRITISQLWNKVCKDRGWSASDRALRLATLGKLLARELTTMDDIGRLDECTKVMNELKAMLGVSLQAGKEAVDQGINRQRNSRWLIEQEVLPCLALYPLDAPMGRVGAQGYLLEVMVDKSRWRKTDQPECDPVLREFDERTTQQILWTLNARLNVKRKAAGHTGHQMKTAAGVRCDCATFCRARLAVQMGENAKLIPALPGGTDQAAAAVKMLDATTPDWGV